MSDTTQIPRSPKLPVVAAKSMLHSQGWKPTKDERATIVAYADWYRMVLELSGPVEIGISVVDIHQPSAIIGHITFTA